MKQINKAYLKEMLSFSFTLFLPCFDMIYKWEDGSAKKCDELT